MQTCQHCGRETPDEPFCTWCGAHLSTQGETAKRRFHSYVAHAGEHVSQPSVVSTIFPHLPRHRMHEFRWALLGGLGVVVALVGGGLVVASILAAAVLVPALYLVYLYEAQVYRDEPAKVVGVTMVAGAVLGVAVSLVADAVLPEQPAFALPTVGFLVGSTIVLPLVQEVLKPLPTLWLKTSGKFNETIDGLTFGIAAGLGFAAAQTIVQFSKVVTTEPVHTNSANWIFYVVGLAVLLPLLQASCTGAIVAALWRGGGGRDRALRVMAVPVALAAHVLYSLVSQLLANDGVNGLIVLIFQAAVVAAMLVYIRHLIHGALLEEAKDFGFQTLVCPHCQHTIGASAFCPLCGGAVSAGPRTVIGTATPVVASATEPAGEGAGGGASA